MKKKSLLFLSVCVMLLLCVALTACSLVTTNEERKASRELATVTVDLVHEYGDGVKVLGNDWNYVVSLPITRRELTTTVTYAINYYSQLYAQYGLTYDYDLDSLLDSGFTQLKKQKYNAIMAMGKLLADSKDTPRFDAMYCRTDEYQAIYGKNLMPEGVLTIAERYAVIGEVNETFQTRLENYLTETEDDDRKKEISEANDAISGFYSDGYFMAGVEIVHKDGEDFKAGLYTDVVIDDGNSDTSDLDYKKIYANVRLTKTDADDQYVPVPIESTSLTTAEKENANNAKYTTAKTATISFSGRVYAAKTEDNDSGYEIESFSSTVADYTLVAPRYQPAAATEEEDEDAALNAVRYVSITTWADEANRTDEMKAIVAEIFDPDPDTYPAEYKLTEIKDAYRQLRTYFKSANIGYSEDAPEKEDASAMLNYTYYNGLKYYYDAEFSSHVLEVLEYELAEKVTSVEREEIVPEYELLVNKDKANYEYLTQAEQVTKFFSTVSAKDADGLSNVYYVPIDALVAESYEVDPTDKRYEALFTLDNAGNVTAYNHTYVYEEDGKYKMHYAYLNEDGTYTINMVYVAHILMAFDNVSGLDEKYANDAQDFADKMVFIMKYVPDIMTDPQLLSYIDEYDADKEYTFAEVYKADENGDPSPETYAEAQDVVTQALTEAFATGKYEDFVQAFYDLVEQYNDDPSFKITGDSGYLVSAGEMNNGWVADFTATALKIYFGLLNSGKVPTGYEEADGTAVADRTAIAYTDYGSHNMILSFAPLYHVAIDEYKGIGLDTKLTTSGTTRFDEVGASLLKTKKQKQYTDWQAAFTEEVVEAATVVNEKNYKNFKKEIK